jgi:hypothetical protein
MTTTGNASESGISMMLFHCLFHADGSTTHYHHDYDEDIYSVLPNLYAVCIADRPGRARKIPAGFIIKTSGHHHDNDFVNALRASVASIEVLSRLMTPKPSFLPAKITVPNGGAITETEMLKVMVNQAMKHGSIGTA